MELQLKNIGMLKEANVKIDGLTVIAGENDTGKSTVARQLHYEVTSLGSLGRFPIPFKRGKLIFDENEERVKRAVLIDTPNSLDTFSFIKNATLLIHQHRLDIHLPLFRVDLILQLSQNITQEENFNFIYKNIEKLIDGKVYYDESKDDILYEKYSLNKTIQMKETSNGVKMFGFLQILLLNNTLDKGTTLILDEPEVHLHPNWQLKMAEVIVRLVKNGVKVLVNSHSPYMIEALKKYSDKEKQEDKTNFYLAEDGYIKQFNNCNSETLEKIFTKLSEPFDIFEELESQRLGNLING